MLSFFNTNYLIDSHYLNPWENLIIFYLSNIILFNFKIDDVTFDLIELVIN